MLPVQVLEQLHVLTNFVRDSKPWLSIILVGLPDLRETLKRNVLASLSARIPIRVQVSPLDADQVKLYIRHRMNSAGCRRDVFSDDALLLISKATGGLMRRIDVLGDRCLTVAMKAKSGIIDASIVQKAIQSCGDALQ
jgi:general secretion pathway protein A